MSFTRSLNTFAGGAAAGYLGGQANQRQNTQLGIIKQKSDSEIDAWKKLGSYFDQYLSGQKGAGSPAAGMIAPAPVGASGMQEQATPGQATPGIGAYMPTGGPTAAPVDAPPAAATPAPRPTARPSLRTLPFLGDSFGDQ